MLRCYYLLMLAGTDYGSIDERQHFLAVFDKIDACVGT